MQDVIKKKGWVGFFLEIGLYERKRKKKGEEVGGGSDEL